MHLFVFVNECVCFFVLSLLFKANSHLIIHIWRQLHDDKSKSSATWIYALCARTVQQHKRRDTLTIIRIVESRARVNVKKATITRETNNNTKRTHKQKTQVLWTRKKAPPIIFLKRARAPSTHTSYTHKGSSITEFSIFGRCTIPTHTHWTTTTAAAPPSSTTNERKTQTLFSTHTIWIELELKLEKWIGI